MSFVPRVAYMSAVWVTTMSTHIESVVNPLIAACETDLVPDDIHLLSNAGVEPYLSPVQEPMTETAEAYGTDEVTVHVTDLETETDFQGIVDHIRTPIETASDEARVAVDVTPGRKFMSAIALQAGLRFDADHVFYLHLDSDAYFDKLYPDIPCTATDLIDFQEVFA